MILVLRIFRLQISWIRLIHSPRKWNNKLQFSITRRRQSNSNTILSQIRILVSAADVIHSWTIPSLGVKIDATPGRLNQVSFTPTRSRLLYGQCSEICGANHRFIPIVAERISPSFFIKWIKKIINLSLDGWK